MTMTLLMLLLSLCIILAACAVFVNAIEYLGNALNLHQGIIGSIFAAIGTALPETLIPIIAILFTKGAASHDIGLGAIVGAPFMLGTLAFFITGSAVLVYTSMGKRSVIMTIDASIMSKDLFFFLCIFSIAILTSILHPVEWLRVVIALLLLASYGIYLKLIIADDAKLAENVEKLYAQRFFGIAPTVPASVVQTLIALGAIIGGSHLFITYVSSFSSEIGVPALVLSLIITPIATELPEKLNSIIWIGRKKDTLALGNITGAMVFQSCFPVVFGMIFTAWELHGLALLSAILSLVSASVTLIWLRIFKSLNPYILLAGGLLYAVFIVALNLGLT